VTYVVRVSIPSRDGPLRVDAGGKGTLEWACARAWNVERGDGAVRGSHEAVICLACVEVLSGNRACRVEAIRWWGLGAL
jgi:hypothetical protein